MRSCVQNEEIFSKVFLDGEMNAPVCNKRRLVILNSSKSLQKVSRKDRMSFTPQTTRTRHVRHVLLESPTRLTEVGEAEGCRGFVSWSKKRPVS